MGRAVTPGSRAQRGSASVAALVLLTLVLAAGTTAAGWSGAVGVRHRASAAADLAAVAAAAQWARGTPPCPRAAELAQANGGVLVGCQVRGADVGARVRVERSVDVLGRRVSLTAVRESWAGPPRREPGRAAPSTD